MTESTLNHKIIPLPGTTVSPETILQRTLEKLPRIKAVAIVIQWDDDTFAADWSKITFSELCMAGQVFDIAIKEELRGDEQGIINAD